MSGGNPDLYRNFNLVNYKKTYTIERAPITVTWSGTTKTYAGAYLKPTATLNGIIPGDSISPVVKVGTSPSNANVNGVINAGNHYAYLTLTGDSAGNYILTGSNSSGIYFTVNKLEVNVNWTAGTYTYNGQQQGPSASIVNDVFTADKNAGNIRLSVTGLGTDAGSYTATAVLSGTAKNNYTLTNATRSYSIGKKLLTVAWSNDTQTYTGSTLTPTAELNGGVVPGDNVSLSVTGAIETGVHDVTATLTGSDAGNYQLSAGGANYVTGKIIITQKPANENE